MTRTLISYDISSSPFRTRVAKSLRRAGATRLQRSVWIHVATAQSRTQLRSDLDGLWTDAGADDHLLWLPLSRNAVKDAYELGAPFRVEMFDVPDSWVVW